VFFEKPFLPERPHNPGQGRQRDRAKVSLDLDRKDLAGKARFGRL